MAIPPTKNIPLCKTPVPKECDYLFITRNEEGNITSWKTGSAQDRFWSQDDPGVEEFNNRIRPRLSRYDSVCRSHETDGRGNHPLFVCKEKRVEIKTPPPHAGKEEVERLVKERLDKILKEQGLTGAEKKVIIEALAAKINQNLGDRRPDDKETTVLLWVSGGVLLAFLHLYLLPKTVKQGKEAFGRVRTFFETAFATTNAAIEPLKRELERQGEAASQAETRVIELLQMMDQRSRDTLLALAEAERRIMEQLADPKEESAALRETLGTIHQEIRGILREFFEAERRLRGELQRQGEAKAAEQLPQGGTDPLTADDLILKLANPQIMERIRQIFDQARPYHIAKQLEAFSIPSTEINATAQKLWDAWKGIPSPDHLYYVAGDALVHRFPNVKHLPISFVVEQLKLSKATPQWVAHELDSESWFQGLDAGKQRATVLLTACWLNTLPTVERDKYWADAHIRPRIADQAKTILEKARGNGSPAPTPTPPPKRPTSASVPALAPVRTPTPVPAPAPAREPTPAPVREATPPPAQVLEPTSARRVTMDVAAEDILTEASISSDPSAESLAILLDEIAKMEEGDSWLGKSADGVLPEGDGAGELVPVLRRNVEIGDEPTLDLTPPPEGVDVHFEREDVIRQLVARWPEVMERMDLNRKLRMCEGIARVWNSTPDLRLLFPSAPGKILDFRFIEIAIAVIEEDEGALRKLSRHLQDEMAIEMAKIWETGAQRRQAQAIERLRSAPPPEERGSAVAIGLDRSGRIHTIPNFRYAARIIIEGARSTLKTFGGFAPLWGIFGAQKTAEHFGLLQPRESALVSGAATTAFFIVDAGFAATAIPGTAGAIAGHQGASSVADKVGEKTGIATLRRGGLGNEWIGIGGGIGGFGAAAWLANQSRTFRNFHAATAEGTKEFARQIISSAGAVGMRIENSARNIIPAGIATMAGVGLATAKAGVATAGEAVLASATATSAVVAAEGIALGALIHYSGAGKYIGTDAAGEALGDAAYSIVDDWKKTFNW